MMRLNQPTNHAPAGCRYHGADTGRQSERNENRGHAMLSIAALTQLLLDITDNS